MFDSSCANVLVVVEGRRDDRRHDKGYVQLYCLLVNIFSSLTRIILCGSGDKLYYMPAATYIADLIRKTVKALEADHAPKALEEVGIQVPGLMWVSLQFCAKNSLSSRALNYTGKLNLIHKVQQRTLRAMSIDSNYVAATYEYM